MDVTELLPADENALADWLRDDSRRKAMHDAKGPLLAIWARGWDLAGLTSDTQLAAYLTRPDQRTFDLADLTIRYLKRELKVEGAVDLTDSDQLSLDFGDDDSGARVAADASMVRATAGDRPRRRVGRRDRAAERHQPAQRGRAPVAPHAGPDGADRGRGRRRAPGGAGVRLRLDGHPGREPGVRGAGQADQPRLAQAAAGGAVRRARNAEDAAYADRATPPTRMRCRASTPRPSTRSWPTCWSTATPSGSSRPSRGC